MTIRYTSFNTSKCMPAFVVYKTCFIYRDMFSWSWSLKQGGVLLRVASRLLGSWKIDRPKHCTRKKEAKACKEDQRLVCTFYWIWIQTLDLEDFGSFRFFYVSCFLSLPFAYPSILGPGRRFFQKKLIVQIKEVHPLALWLSKLKHRCFWDVLAWSSCFWRCFASRLFT